MNENLPLLYDNSLLDEGGPQSSGSAMEDPCSEETGLLFNKNSLEGRAQQQEVPAKSLLFVDMNSA